FQKIILKLGIFHTLLNHSPNMKQKPSVRIAVAAYNSEKNIQHLIQALLSQQRVSYHLDSLIIYSDGSSDDTVKNAKTITHPKLQIVGAKKNIGFANVVKKLIKENTADILVMLNDDIKINDNLLIEKLIQPFKKST